MLDRGLDVTDEQLPKPVGRRELASRPPVATLEEALGPLLHDLEQQLLFGADVRVEGAPLEAERIAEVLHRGAVIAALGEQPGGGPNDLGPPRAACLLQLPGPLALLSGSQTNSRLVIVHQPGRNILPAMPVDP